MVTTPSIWEGQHRANPTLNGDQSDPAILDIGMGRYVVVWTEAEGGPIATAPGTDIVGQIFDAEGQPVGDEFKVNYHFMADNEHNAALAARPGGGFVVVYEDTSGGGTSIRAESYDVDGTNLGPVSIQSDDGPDTLSNPSIATQADGSYLVAYQRSDNAGDTDIVAKIVDSDGIVGDEFFIFNSTDDMTNPDVAALSNGSYVIVCHDEFSGQVTNTDVRYSVRSATGETVRVNAVATGPTLEDDAQVAALEGGGFVIAWADDEGDGAGNPGIRARVYDNNGVPLGDAFPVNATTNGDQHAPDLTPLKDGGFVVVWDNDGASSTKGQRFDKDGNPVGDEFVAGSHGNEVDPVVAALGDGRFVTAFTQSFGNDDIYANIFDPREKAIKGSNDDDVLTSRKDGATVDGRKGDDTLLGQDARDTLKGRKGDDTLEGRGGKDKLIGGKGDDTMTGGGGKDKFVFDTKLNAGTNVDAITDFQVGKDMIQLDEGIFGKIGSKLGAGEFHVGSEAKDSNDHVIYNDDNGKLYYDKNGDNSGGKTLFAILDDNLNLDHHDFDMV